MPQRNGRYAVSRGLVQREDKVRAQSDHPRLAGRFADDETRCNSIARQRFRGTPPEVPSRVFKSKFKVLFGVERSAIGHAQPPARFLAEVERDGIETTYTDLDFREM